MTSKMMYNIFSVIHFLTRIDRIMDKMTDSILYILTPATNASGLQCPDSQILMVYHDIIRDVTKYILVIPFFLVLFSVKSDLNAYSLETVQYIRKITADSRSGELIICILT